MQPTLSAKYIVNANFSLHNRKVLSRYGNIEAYRLRSTEISRLRGVTAINRNAVTQAFWRDFAVCTYQESQTQDFTELDDLLRQKPTSIERGVPVGTKGLDRGAELSEFCAGSQPVRAMRGAIRV
jgi:hypothetical protein